jgi:hypothetical protein
MEPRLWIAAQRKVTDSLKKYAAFRNQTEDESQTNFLAEITRGGGDGDASPSPPHVVTVRVHADFVDPLAQQQMTLELGNGVARVGVGEGTVCTLVGGDLEWKADWLKFSKSHLRKFNKLESFPPFAP